MASMSRDGLIGCVVEAGEDRTPRPEETPARMCYRLSRRLDFAYPGARRRALRIR